MKKENRAAFMERIRKFTKNEMEVDEIMFAYDISKEAHRTHKRDSGERYFEHPRAGILIMLDEIGWYDKEAIIAFLFHDIGEDSPLFGNRREDHHSFSETLRFRIGRMFGERVADLVLALTKPRVEGIRFSNKKETEAF